MSWFLFVFLLPWVSSLIARSHVFYVLSTCTRRQPHVPHGLDLQRESKSSEKEGKQAELWMRSWQLERRSGESDGAEIYSKILNFDQIYIEKYDA